MMQTGTIACKIIPNCLKDYTGEVVRKLKEIMKEHKNNGEKW